MKWRIALIFMLALPALFVTFSRSAWLAFLVGIAILLGTEVTQWRPSKTKSVLGLGLLSVLVLSPFVWQYSQYIGARLNAENSFEKNSN